MLFRKTAIRSLKGLKNGLDYVETDWELKGAFEEATRGIHIDGDPNATYQVARTIKGGNVGYSMVVSFAETEEELRGKLAKYGKDLYDLWEEIKSFLFYGYREGEITYSVVAHRGDEGKPHKEHENFHFHIHIANRLGTTDKPLRFWFFQKDLDLFKAYIDRKYGLKSPLPADHPYMQLPLERLEELLEQKLERRKQYIAEYYKGIDRGNYGDFFPLPTRPKPKPPKPTFTATKNKEEEDPFFWEDKDTSERQAPLPSLKLDLPKKPHLFKVSVAFQKGQEAKIMRKNARTLRKEIELPELLNFFGIPYYQSIRKDGKPYLLARVPWREDKNPSLYAIKGDEGYWRWFDLSKRETGTIIDFVIRYKDLDFVQTLDFLSQKLEKIKQAKPVGSLVKTKAVKLENLRNPEEEEIALNWLKEVWKFKAFPPSLKVANLIVEEEKVKENPKGFAELKVIRKEHPNPVMVWIDEEGNPVYWRDLNPTKSYKGFIQPNKPRVIKGQNRNLYVVEGFTDYLALYQMDPNGNFLILGTAQNTDKILKTLNELSDKYRIFIVLDNDNTGKEATEKILKVVPQAEDLAYLYADHKDIAEAWIETNGQIAEKLKRAVNPKFTSEYAEEIYNQLKKAVPEGRIRVFRLDRETEWEENINKVKTYNNALKMFLYSLAKLEENGIDIKTFAQAVENDEWLSADKVIELYNHLKMGDLENFKREFIKAYERYKFVASEIKATLKQVLKEYQQKEEQLKHQQPLKEKHNFPQWFSPNQGGGFKPGR